MSATHPTLPASRTALRWRWPVFLGLALLCLWPAMINGGPLVFFDSAGYYNGGLKALETAGAMLGLGMGEATGGTAGAAGGGQAAADTDVQSIRSVAFAVFTFAASQTLLALNGPVLALSLTIGWFLWLFYRHRHFTTRDAMGLGALALLTPLPWFSSFLMPDLLAAIPILVALIALQDAERIGWPVALALLLTGAFAAMSHYGHIPLALGMGGLTAGILLLQRRLGLRLLLALILPAFLAVGTNIAISKIAFDQVSATPKRLPVLLARSIEDGPAQWHLDAHCATEAYAVCPFYDLTRDDGSEFLFSPDGIKRASPAEIERIRREEPLILWRAFLEYPIAQIMSLGRNAALQMVKFGLQDFRWGTAEFSPDGRMTAKAPPRGDRTLEVLAGAFHAGVVALSVVFILLLLLRGKLRHDRREGAMVLALLLGLMANAAIFGGLSAPADRYQGRLIWMVPLLALLLWNSQREWVGGDDDRRARD